MISTKFEQMCELNVLLSKHADASAAHARALDRADEKFVLVEKIGDEIRDFVKQLTGVKNGG